jgi:hypothetical protein
MQYEGMCGVEGWPTHPADPRLSYLFTARGLTTSEDGVRRVEEARDSAALLVGWATKDGASQQHRLPPVPLRPPPSQTARPRAAHALVFCRSRETWIPQYVALAERPHVLGEGGREAECAGGLLGRLGARQWHETSNE